MKQNIVLTTLALIALVGSSYAQQRAAYTQYMYTTQVFNPAYAGTTSHPEITGAHRAQWAGIEGAPQTTTIAFNMPMNKGLGLGVVVMNDQIGAMRETSAKIDLAYRLKVNRKINWSFGVTAGGNSMNVDLDDLNFYHPNEVITTGNLSLFAPIAGAGTFMYSEKFYVGLSVPNVIRSSAIVDTYGRRIQGNFMAGYVFESKNTYSSVKVKPALMVSYVNGAPLSWNLSTNVMFKDKYVAGLGYQWRSGISVLLGMHMTKRWFLGYSFDWNLSPLRSFNYGSHDIVLRAKLGNLNRKYRWTSSRFF